MEFFSVDFLNNIGSFIAESPILGYFLLALVFMLRGEITLLVAVYLTVKGFLSWFIMVPVIFIAMVLNDYVVYFLGRWVRSTKFNDYVENEYVLPEKFKEYFRRNFVRFMFLVKFTMGLATITMFLSGWSKIKFKRFFKIHTTSSIFWMFTTIVVGYTLITSLGYLHAMEILDGIEFIVLGIIIAFFGLEYLIQRFLRRESGIGGHKPIRAMVKEKREKRGENVVGFD